MPATDQEITEFATEYNIGIHMPDTIDDIVWRDGSRITRLEKDQVCFRAYGFRYQETLDHRRKFRPAQCKAMRLLRSLISNEQKRQIDTNGYFFVTGTLGNRYKIYCYLLRTERVVQHGKNHFNKGTYCIHAKEVLPPADLAIAHMLMLRTDEREFLQIANYTVRLSNMWNGEYISVARRNRRDPEHQRRIEEATQLVIDGRAERETFLRQLRGE